MIRSRGGMSRWRRWAWMLLVLLVVAGPSAARAQGTTTAVPLELAEVLGSVRRTHPSVEVAQREVDERDGRALAARGGFDPTLTVRGKWAPVGYYPHGGFDALVRQATPLWGVSAHAGYRLGLGSYPAYKGDQQTRSGGELRAGVSVPLWRNGPIDERRANVRKTRIERRGAEHQLDVAQLRVERDATKAYWSWVAAGNELEVVRALLELAQARQTALADQVAAGSVPRIVLVDNRRLVLDRQAKVVEARRKLQVATLELSLYLRDAELRPLRPGPERLPSRLPGPGGVDLGTIEDAVARALQQRPDRRALDAERQAADVEVRLAANQRGPAVDVQAFVARDLGDGPAQLQPTEVGVGLTVEMALPLRKARGDHRAARAKAGQIDAKRRALRDEVEAEVREAWAAVEAAQERVALAQAQHDAAATLAEAERTRLREGSSDLLVVNLRELAVADAAIGRVDALASYHRAHADLVAAVGGTSIR